MEIGSSVKSKCFYTQNIMLPTRLCHISSLAKASDCALWILAQINAISNIVASQSIPESQTRNFNHNKEYYTFLFTTYRISVDYGILGEVSCSYGVPKDF